MACPVQSEGHTRRDEEPRIGEAVFVDDIAENVWAAREAGMWLDLGQT